MLDRDKVIERAVLDCYREMYRKAQPRANFDDYRRKIEKGELPKDTRIYERHYLPQKEYEYILDKYRKAYRFVNEWKSNCEFLKDCFINGGYIDSYKNDERSAEHTKPLIEIIGEENAKKVIDLLKGFMEFYHFDREDYEFSASVALGCSPTSNPKTVIDYWKSQGIDIKIDEKKNLTEDDYWEIDYYGHRLR